jgi:hypothetical protein
VTQGARAPTSSRAIAHASATEPPLSDRDGAREHRSRLEWRRSPERQSRADLVIGASSPIRSDAWRYESGLVCEDHSLDAAMEAELEQDAGDVALHRRCPGSASLSSGVLGRGSGDRRRPGRARARGRGLVPPALFEDEISPRTAPMVGAMFGEAERDFPCSRQLDRRDDAEHTRGYRPNTEDSSTNAGRYRLADIDKKTGPKTTNELGRRTTSSGGKRSTSATRGSRTSPSSRCTGQRTIKPGVAWSNVSPTTRGATSRSARRRPRAASMDNDRSRARVHHRWSAWSLRSRS